MRRIRWPGVMAMFALALGLYADDPSPSAQSTTALVTRVEQYWALRQAKDLAGAWTFYCAEYRARVPRPEYMKMLRLIRFDLRDLKVAQTVVAGNTAQVTISYQLSLLRLPGQDVEGRATQRWALEDGEWCKTDEALELPFPTATGERRPPAPANDPPR